MVHIPEQRKNKGAQQAAPHKAHPFVAKVPRAVSNLRWEPEDATFGARQRAKLLGDTSLPEGTTVRFTSHDRLGGAASLPELQATVQGQRIELEWDLASVYAAPGLTALELETVLADEALAGNVARLKLRDQRCLAERVLVGRDVLDGKEGKRPRAANTGGCCRWRPRRT